MRCDRAVPLLVALAAAGCVEIPNTYAPPVQRRPFEIPEPGGVRHFIAMNNPAASAHILSDISRTPEEGAWRWTGQRPTLRFRLPANKRLRLVMDFSIAEATFASTGPLTISYFINGRLLDRVRYDSHGVKHFEKRLDPGWVVKGEDTIVAAELDKIWVAPDDGAKLGVILVRAGFLD